MVGWSIKGDENAEIYTPMERGALVADIELCRRHAKDGFAMVCVNVMSTNGLTLKRASGFDNMDDLLSKLMDFSLTCSIADTHTVLDDQILILILVETDGSTTNIDAEAIDAISKLSFKGELPQSCQNLSAFVR